MSGEKDQGKQPKFERAFDAFAVRNDKDGKGHFHKVGAAFAHKDGKGYDIDMVATPSNGRLTLRTPQERLETQRGEERVNTNGASRERE